MTIDISQLERAWLQAETAADEAKHEAMRLSAELAKRRQGRGEEAPDDGALVVSIERIRERQAEAERTASAAFDRYYTARSDGSAGSAYA